MPPKPLSLPQLGAVVAGNALEFYDFLIFSFFAVQIGQVFFPGKDTTGSLLLTLATFGVGFRHPAAGRVVIGTLGDPGPQARHAVFLRPDGRLRRRAGADAVLCQHRLAAPLLAVLFRLLQGFALGGEVGPDHRLPAGSGAAATPRALCLAAERHPVSRHLGGGHGRPDAGQPAVAGRR